MSSKAPWLFAGILFLLICSSASLAHDVLWESYIEAGKKSFQQSQYAEAEELFLAALKEAENLGSNDPRLATSLHSLAVVYQYENKYDQALNLYRKALEINERTLGKEHPQVAGILNDLAMLSLSQGKYAEAESLFKRAITINEKAYGKENRDLACNLNNLGLVYRAMGKNALAGTLFQRALTIREKAPESEQQDVAQSLYNLAELYLSQGNCSKAEPLFQKAFAIWNKTLGPQNPMVAEILKNYRELLRQTCSEDETAKVAAQIQAFHAKDVVPASMAESIKNEPGTAATERFKYLAPAKGKTYHCPGCNLIKNVSTAKLRKFSSAEEARRAGYRPCPHCQNLPDSM